MHRFHWILLALVFQCIAPNAYALGLPLTKQAATDPALLAVVMPEFARKALENYQEDDQDKLLVNRMRLQIVAGDYRDALGSIKSVRQLRESKADPQAATAFLVNQIYAEAMLEYEAGSAGFDVTFERAFRNTFGRLDDRKAMELEWLFSVDMQRAEADLAAAAIKAGATPNASVTDALDLVRRYQFVQVYSRVLPLAEGLLAEDEARRYHIEKNVLVAMPDGTKIEALVVRPASAKAPLTTLLGYTIYANGDWALTDAKIGASYGYAGVVAFSRGKGLGDGPIIPYEHDGKDAAEVINWISKQPWSDGRVGMYGNSYNSFTQWAAAKHRPPALKAMMTSGSAAPGIDVPMQGNIFQNFIYPWPFYTMNNKSLDDATYENQKRWDTLYQSWYKAGSAYRDMDVIDGTPNPIFRRWLEHPDYDAYWQAMTPQREEYAEIDFPVLAVTGYFDGGRVGVQHYYDQHTRYNPQADHTLLIGPFGHLSINSGVARQIEGYDLDQTALVDLQALRYEWFNHIFKGAAKPDLLKDRVNYQVMGGNEWKHAPTLPAMGNGMLRFYLQPGNGGMQNQLVTDGPAKKAFVTRRVDFTDRSDGGWVPAANVITESLEERNGISYISEPIETETEISGLMTGMLDFAVNKRDVDLGVTLYEKMENGDFFQLTYHLGRASYAKDRSKRQLLTPGQRQQIDFRSERLVSRKLQPGSRLVIVLQVIKQPDQQINYGTGRDVSDETIADAGKPLEIRWYGNSYVDLPIWQKVR
jgi:putative CocE/NonD family hydrolase